MRKPPRRWHLPIDGFSFYGIGQRNVKSKKSSSRLIRAIKNILDKPIKLQKRKDDLNTKTLKQLRQQVVDIKGGAEAGWDIERVKTKSRMTKKRMLIFIRENDQNYQ